MLVPLTIARGLVACLFAVVFLLPAPALAQESPFITGIKSSFQHKPKPDIRFDTRNSFITTRVAKMRGIKLGLDFNKTVKVGIGYNWLASDLTEDRSYLTANGERYTAPHRLSFGYVSPYIEYTFFREGRWEAGIPVHIGLGSARYKYTDVYGQDRSTEANTILLYEPYMTCQYKPIRYFAIGVGTGYRLLFAGNRNMPENFNSPIYVLKFNLLFGEIVKDLKGR